METSKAKYSRARLLMHPKPVGGRTRNHLVCVCGKCNCNKRHHCSLHHGEVTHLTGPKSEQKLPQSEYVSSFLHRAKSAAQPRRRSMKVPFQFLPTLPREKMASQTIYHCDYIPQPPFQRPKDFKPEEKYRASPLKMKTTTSYNACFSQQPLMATCPAPSLMETTMPTIRDTADNFQTSHQQLYKHWPGFHRPLGYCEPLQCPIFHGKFSGLTVTMKDFPQKPLCRPRTCYRKEDEGIFPSIRYSQLPANASKLWKLPEITDCSMLRTGPWHSSEPVLSITDKEKNGVHHEIKKPPFVPSHSQGDNCLEKVSCQNSFSISSQKNKKNLAANPECYTMSEKQLSQEMAPKRSTEDKELMKPLNKFSCNKLSLKRVRKKLQTTVKETGESSQEISDGEKMNQFQKFDDQKSRRNKNQSDYFHFSTTTPHVCHGDKCGRIFQLSGTKFVDMSENQSSFVPQMGEPSELTQNSYKSASEQESISRMMKPFTAATTYHEFFPVRSLPKQEICPVEQMLQA